MDNPDPFKIYNDIVNKAYEDIKNAFRESLNQWFNLHPLVTKVKFTAEDDYNDNGYDTYVYASISTIMDVDPDDLNELEETLSEEYSDIYKWFGSDWSSTFTSPIHQGTK